MDQEIPDYDMDSEDEQWLNKQAKKMEVTPLKFENMLDRLEKGSGQTVSLLHPKPIVICAVITWTPVCKFMLHGFKSRLKRLLKLP